MSGGDYWRDNTENISWPRHVTALRAHSIRQSTNHLCPSWGRQARILRASHLYPYLHAIVASIGSPYLHHVAELSARKTPLIRVWTCQPSSLGQILYLDQGRIVVFVKGAKVRDSDFVCVVQAWTKRMGHWIVHQEAWDKTTQLHSSDLTVRKRMWSLKTEWKLGIAYLSRAGDQILSPPLTLYTTSIVHIQVTGHNEVLMFGVQNSRNLLKRTHERSSTYKIKFSWHNYLLPFSTPHQVQYMTNSFSKDPGQFQ